MVQIKPLADRVVIERVEALEKTAAGIVIPDTAKEKPEQGKILAAGKEVKEVKVGDSVLFSKYATNEVKLDGKEYLLVKEEDILAVLQK